MSSSNHNTSSATLRLLVFLLGGVSLVQFCWLQQRSFPYDNDTKNIDHHHDCDDTYGRRRMIDDNDHNTSESKQRQEPKLILTTAPITQAPVSVAPTPTPAPTPIQHPVKRYHEYPATFFAEDQLERDAKNPYKMAFQEATVMERAFPWFEPQRKCLHTETANCCAETVAISLDQDDHHIVNTADGQDLADINQEYNHQRMGLLFSDSARKYRSADYKNHLWIDERMAPCFQPGTIISIDNHNRLLQHFFEIVRPHMKHPYVILTTESDGVSPSVKPQKLFEDELLLKWYGTNPNPMALPENQKRYGGTVVTEMHQQQAKGKFVPLPLGLSRWHDQSRMLNKFWELRNYTDPFAGSQKDRWIRSPLWEAWKSKDERRIDDEFYDNVFVRFSIKNPRSMATRGPLFQSICDAVNNTATGRKNHDGFSCRADGHLNPDAQYRAASKFLFGFSPKGAGWDCYRNYELLMLGVIPIVPAIDGGTMDLFENIPVIELEDFYKNRTRAEYIEILYNYIQSQKFQAMDTTAGYKRLFLRYWRRKILEDTGRDKDILVDPSTGREYYQAWRYYSTSPAKPTPAPTEAPAQTAIAKKR